MNIVSRENVNLPQSLRSAIEPFIVMDVLRQANEREASGADIIHMEVGQPGTPAPRLAREAAKRAIDTDRLGYTEALGIPALRARIARHYREAYGIDIAPERVIVTTGSSAGFVLAFLCLFDAGARLALPQPGYPCYRQIARALSLEPVPIETGAATRWMPSAEDVEASGAQGFLIASPANPTGAMLEASRLGALAELCERLAIPLVSDEIYHGLTYAGPAETALRFSQKAIVINSFSKYFSMTGWRIGWMVAPESLVRPIERLQQNLHISPPAISQFAALAAFDAAEELEAYKATYAANRALLLNALPEAGFTDLAPADGAFYIYANVSRLTDDSVDFAARMLNEIGVAVTPGVDFDPLKGRQFIRFSYAGETESIAEAARRLRNWLRR